MTATAVGLAIVVCLAVINFRLGGSVMYPPTHFALIWAALLTASLFSAGNVFPLSADAIAVFTAGAIALSAGGAARLLFERQRPRETRLIGAQPVCLAIERLLAAGLVGLVLLLPVFWRYMLSLADPRFSNMWWAIRSGTLAMAEVQGQKSWEQVFFDNVTVLAILLALTAATHYGERGSSKVVAIGLVLTAAAYSLATASRTGGAMVLMGVFAIRIMKRGGVTGRHVAAGLLGVLLMFLPITLLRVAKGGDVASIADTDVRVVGDTALLYTVGPLAAFDAYLQSPSTLGETWTIYFFFLHAANRMGFDVQAPSTHLGYVSVGPAGATNVYTMYLAYYPEFGVAGVMVLSAIVGYFLVWLYCCAAAQGGYVLILYGLAFNEVCKSGFSEGFFNGLNTWLKAALFCLVLYGIQRIARRPAPIRQPERLRVCCE